VIRYRADDRVVGGTVMRDDGETIAFDEDGDPRSNLAKARCKIGERHGSPGVGRSLTACRCTFWKGRPGSRSSTGQVSRRVTPPELRVGSLPSLGAGLVQVIVAGQFDCDVDPLDPFVGLSEPEPGPSQVVSCLISIAVLPVRSQRFVSPRRV
jgi:hypothetical protein